MGTDKKIKVCHLISGDLWAGAEVQAYILLDALREVPSIKQFAIVLNEGKLSNELKKSGIETVVIEEKNYGFIQIYRLLKRWMEDREIDILHTHRYKENALGTLLKIGGSTKYLIQTVHGGNEPFPGIRKIKNVFTGMINSFVTRYYFDRIITVSIDIKENLSKKINPQKIVTIHNSVNISAIKPVRSADDIKNELGIKLNQLLIGTVGRMVAIKGFDILLSAIRIIIATKPEIMLLLAGDGPLKPALMQRAQELHIGENVMFLGFREDIVDIINCFDIFVISSHHEGIPTAMLEAMVLKKAVISTNVGGIPEVIQDGVSGILANPGNAESIATACLKVLENPGLRVRLENRAEVRVREGFSSQVQKDCFLGLYKEILYQE